MKATITSYLADLASQMKRNGTFHADLMEEIETHLLESAETNLRRGLNQAEAESEALRSFGSVETIAFTFEKERITPMQNIMLAISMLFGLMITYVDSQPNWDDTGISAGAILIVCGLLALIGFRRPWLLALLVGAWIPLYGIFVTHNYGSILALIIAFIGAYAGWAFRLGMQAAFKTSQ